MDYGRILELAEIGRLVYAANEEAQEFVDRATIEGFRIVRNDASGTYLQRGSYAVGVIVLNSYDPKKIWCLSVASSGYDTVNLMNEGKWTKDAAQILNSL